MGRQPQTVKPFGQIDHRVIAARAHIGDDVGHAGIDIGRIFALHLQKRGEALGEIGIPTVQESWHLGSILELPSV